MIEDTKVVINSRTSKKDRQYNDQKVEEGQTIQWPKEKAQHNDMPVTGQKTKYLLPELIFFGQN
jgi:hypothetical protein